MSYWSHNPELYDEIIYNRLVEEGLVEEDDEREIFEIVHEFMQRPDSWKLAVEAERDYWADIADATDTRRELAEDR